MSLFNWLESDIASIVNTFLELCSYAEPVTNPIPRLPDFFHKGKKEEYLIVG